MGYIIEKTNSILIYKTIISNVDLLTMGTKPITLNCYDNTNFNINGKVFIPFMASIQNYLSTIPFTSGVGVNDHLTILLNPGIGFFWYYNILAATDSFVYSSNFIQRVHNISGANLSSNYNPDKLSGIVTFTNTTGIDPSGGDGGLIVNIAGYMADFN